MAADEEDTVIDDAWTTGSPAHNDRTTHGLYVPPANKPMAIGTGADHTVKQDEDSSVVALDAAMEQLTPKSGGGVATLFSKPAPPPKSELEQPERSPLSFVMRDMGESNAAPREQHSSGDSSKIFASLVGNQPPPQVVAAEKPAAITAVPPALARRRQRKTVMAIGAFAVMALIIGAVAFKISGPSPSKSTANAAAAPVAPADPAPAAAPADPEPAAAPAEEAAVADPEPVTEPTPKPATHHTAKKKAVKKATGTKSTATKKSATTTRKRL